MEFTFVYELLCLCYFACAVLFTRVVGETDCRMKDSLFGRIAVLTDSGDLNRASKEVFNIDRRSNEGFVSVGRGECSRWNVSLVNAAEDRDSEVAVYNKETLRAITSAQLILGPVNRGVQSYVSQSNCSECSGLYFIKDPVGSNMERIMEDRYLRGGGDIMTIFSLWPSPTSVINCVAGNAILQTTHVGMRKKIMVLTYTENDDSTMYAGRLVERLEEERMQVFVGDIHPIVELVIRGNLTAKQMSLLVKPIQRTIFENKADLVILYMDTSVQVRVDTLAALFSGKSRLDREGSRWLLVDLETGGHPGIREKLHEVLDLEHTIILALASCAVFEPLNDVKPILNKCGRIVKYSDDDIETKKMKAGHELFQTLLNYRRRRNVENDAIAGLMRFMQTECPRRTNVTQSMLDSADLLGCAPTDSVRRVGFPRFDHILTQRIYPKRGDSDHGVYMPGDLLNAFIQKLLDKADKSSPRRADRLRAELATMEIIPVRDYAMFGVKPKVRLDYASVVVEEPFVIRASDGSLSGMCIDIYNAVVMKLVQKRILLKLRFKEADSYGSRQLDGAWTGVFGDMKKRPDPFDKSRTVLGLGQISINKERHEDPFFTFSTEFGLTTMTYMTKRIAVDRRYLQFLRPFTTDVWLMLGLVFVISGVYFRVIQGWNPFREELPEGSNFNSRESFWHSYLIVTQIGAPFGAVHLPSRVYSVVYWFFALVVVGCYTGNLAGFLTESTSIAPNIVELVNERGFKFGMLSNSSVSTSYLNHVFEHTHKKLTLDSNKLELVNDYQEGVRKVKEEDFILIGTSLVMEHYEQSDEECDLSVYDSVNFYDARIQAIAFPMRNDWELADSFKWAMNSLKQTGELQLIYRKWISSNKKCQLDDSENDSKQLGWDNFIGLYILTAFGIVISYIFLAFKLGHLKLKEGGKEPTRVTGDPHEEIGLTEERS